jgi:hypothetical protein
MKTFLPANCFLLQICFGKGLDAYSRNSTKKKLKIGDSIPKEIELAETLA